ncbi:uncharacterized protein LOC135474966 [Liolophura sinensis]|uniref:uncharacterized protein LOC135474966 n=1 Tax=Liolophura sinensis TaxID=3198878 RepID=UPI0031596B5E
MDICIKDISYGFFQGNFSSMYSTYLDQTMDRFGQPVMLRLVPKGQKSSSTMRTRNSDKEWRSNSTLSSPVPQIPDVQITKRSPKNGFIITKSFAQDFGVKVSPAQSAVASNSLTETDSNTVSSAQDDKDIYQSKLCEAIDLSALGDNITNPHTHHVNFISGPSVQNEKVTLLQTQDGNIIITNSHAQMHSSIVNSPAHEGSISNNLLAQDDNVFATQAQGNSVCDSSAADGSTINTPTHDGSTINTPTHDGGTINTLTHDSGTINTPTHDDGTINTPTHDSSTINTPTRDGGTINTPIHDSCTINTPTQDENVSCLNHSVYREHYSHIAMSSKHDEHSDSVTDKHLSQISNVSEPSLNQSLAPSVTTIQDPASQKLKWQNPPLSVLVVKKMFDDSVVLPFTDLVSWLIEEKKMIVFIEHKVLSDPLLQTDAHFNCLTEKLHTFGHGDDLTGKIDFIICLGGDGTLLHASSLFQQSVPPVMAFHLGSLGFLTPFEFVNFRDQVTQVLEGNAALTLRSRLKCVVTKDRDGVQSLTRLKNDPAYSCAEILVLNEVVIDRGPCPYLCNLDLYIEGRLVTSVQGDGLIVSTPTGSTAYAVAAGASMMHPNVPAIMITPICPHSLSFRPIVVPAGVEIKLLVSPEARNSAWVSFDGRNRQEIQQGDSVRITTARFPVPSVCKTDQIDDWFNSLAECLHWNVRKSQLPLSSRNSTGTLDSDSESNHSNR